MAKILVKRVPNYLVNTIKIGIVAILLATSFSAKALTHITSFNQAGYDASTCHINGSPTLTGATITGDITLANGLNIPDYAFKNNPNITSVEALGSIGTIGVEAFLGCPANTLTFGDVITIKRDAFANCKAETITFGDVTTINQDAFANCKATLIFGNVITISSYAFRSCDCEDAITFGNVITISSYAFNGCSKAKTITFGDVTTIDYRAFNGCNALVSLTFGANPPNVESSEHFRNCYNLTTIYVPDLRALSKYQKHPFWGSLPYTLEAIDKTPIPRNKTKIKEIRIKRGKLEIKPRR